MIHVASDLSGGICFLLYFYIWEICRVVKACCGVVGAGLGEKKQVGSERRSL